MPNSIAEVAFFLNDKPAQANTGQTLLQAAREAGIELPTLCYHPDLSPRTSCFLCVVRVEGRESLQPACATPVEDGMRVWTDTPEIHESRRAALELMLSDHGGRCVGPCQSACAARLPVDALMQHIAEGNGAGAAQIAREALFFPGLLSQLCDAPCEKACIRGKKDAPLTIRALHGYLAQEDDPEPPEPLSEPAKVAIVGAGPSGMALAAALLLRGIACRLLDRKSSMGGHWREAFPGAGEMVDREGRLLFPEGIFEGGKGIESRADLEVLQENHDAVVLALGPLSPEEAEKYVAWGLPVEEGRFLSEQGRLGPHLFTVGACEGGKFRPVQLIAAGKARAESLAAFLKKGEWSPPQRPFFFAHPGETERLLAHSPVLQSPIQKEAPLTPSAVQAEAGRCLHCDCLAAEDCRLRELAGRFGAKARRFAGEGRSSDPDHSHGQVIYDAGKCVSCGLCVAWAEQHDKKRGPCFQGRGFAVTVGSPFKDSWMVAGGEDSKTYVALCPTGALRLKK